MQELETLIPHRCRDSLRWNRMGIVVPVTTCRCVVPLAMVHLSLDLGNRQGRLEEAEELKQEGNDLFRLNKWNEALQSYRNGLARLPKRRCPPAPQSTPRNEQGDLPPAAEGDTSHSPTEIDSQSASSASPSVDSPLERECAKTRSVLNANIAACHVKLVRVHARSNLKVESILCSGRK